MIKRIGLLLVAALMAAMMLVATAAPAFANRGGGEEVVATQCKHNNPNCTEPIKTNGSGKVMDADTCGGCDETTSFRGGRGNQ